MSLEEANVIYKSFFKRNMSHFIFKNEFVKRLYSTLIAYLFMSPNTC